MIIGISGKMGTGKTTMANHLVDLCGGERASFADALRDEVSMLFDIPVDTLKSRDCKENMTVAVGQRRMTIRELLQWWGALRREQNINYWVWKVIEAVDGGELVIIDDVRYRNEAEAILAVGGKIVRLEPYPGWTPGTGSDHTSETELDCFLKFDAIYEPIFGGLKMFAFHAKETLLA